MPDQPEPFRYTIDDVRRLVIIEYSTPAPFGRWRATMERILADPAYRTDYWFLGDRRVIHAAPTIEYAENIVRYFADDPGRWQGVRWANLVAADEPAVYGMGRMIELLAEAEATVEVRTFSDYNEAVRWVTRPARSLP